MGSPTSLDALIEVLNWGKGGGEPRGECRGVDAGGRTGGGWSQEDRWSQVLLSWTLDHNRLQLRHIPEPQIVQRWVSLRKLVEDGSHP